MEDEIATEDPYLVVYYPALLDRRMPGVPQYQAFGDYTTAKLFFE